MKQGLLLINLGTPDAADTRSVRKYLKTFLSDPRVIDLPAALRYVLLYGVILPFRPKQSAHAYQSIWTSNGSPLLSHSNALVEKVRVALGAEWSVALGMRYGNPSLESAVAQLSDCQAITILPLFPQYSSAATGSAIEAATSLLLQKSIIPQISALRDFHQAPEFIHAQSLTIQPLLDTHDHVLFSFHGVPERHLQKEGCRPVCNTPCPVPEKAIQGCYRAQCYATAYALSDYLNLDNQHYSVSFQSRLGKTPWIRPYTDEYLKSLIDRGIKKLIIACPSFVADCLETLEEIGIQAKEQWLSLGGEQLSLAPAVNSDDAWVKGICSMVRQKRA